MGGCISVIQYEDEDDKAKRINDKRVAKELEFFREQLRKQRMVYSELDMNGKPRVR